MGDATTAATKNQTKPPEILNRKTNSKAMVQMTSMTQAEKMTKLKTKLEGTSNVWGFGGFWGGWWWWWLLFVWF